jgi:hypothetical protein
LPRWRGLVKDGGGMFLARSLLFTIAAHALGMVTMALLLLPGMPGGGRADDAGRMAYIAAHPWLWRLGWFPWQLTALSDLLLAIALLRAPRVPRSAALFTFVVTAAAIVPDQYGQLAWMTQGIALASGEAAPYLAYERRIFESTAVWGAALYTLGALGWTWCFAAAGLWSRHLTWISLVLWPLFAAAAFGPLLGVDAKLVAGANALGFVLLELWFVLVTREVFRRPRTA